MAITYNPKGKATRGQPPKPPGKRRDKIILVRLTRAEHGKLTARAAAEKLTISQIIRHYLHKKDL